MVHLCVLGFVDLPYCVSVVGRRQLTFLHKTHHHYHIHQCRLPLFSVADISSVKIILILVKHVDRPRHLFRRHGFLHRYQRQYLQQVILRRWHYFCLTFIIIIIIIIIIININVLSICSCSGTPSSALDVLSQSQNLHYS